MKFFLCALLLFGCYSVQAQLGLPSVPNPNDTLPGGPWEFSDYNITVQDANACYAYLHGYNVLSECDLDWTVSTSRCNHTSFPYPPLGGPAGVVFPTLQSCLDAQLNYFEGVGSNPKKSTCKVEMQAAWNWVVANFPLLACDSTDLNPTLQSWFMKPPQASYP